MKVLKQKYIDKRNTLKIWKIRRKLKEKSLVLSHAYKLLIHNFNGVFKQLFENQVCNARLRDKHSNSYREEVKQSAMTLHYYSPKAYDFVHKVLLLPHPTSIKTWVASVDCEPDVSVVCSGWLRIWLRASQVCQMLYWWLMQWPYTTKEHGVIQRKNVILRWLIMVQVFLKLGMIYLLRHWCSQFVVVLVIGSTQLHTFYNTKFQNQSKHCWLMIALACCTKKIYMPMHWFFEGAYNNQSRAT